MNETMRLRRKWLERGFAADFNSQEACEAARAAFVAEAGTHQTIVPRQRPWHRFEVVI